MIPVDGRNHASLISKPEGGMVELINDFLKIGESDSETYDKWLLRAKKYGEVGLQKMLVNPGSGATGVAGDVNKFFGHLFAQRDELMEGWQQFIVHAKDERGDGISDYMIEVLTNDNTTWAPFKEMYTDVHANGPDSSFRCFHLRLPRGTTTGRVPLRVRFNASTGTDLMAYQGYGLEKRQLSATAEPVELDITNLGQGTLFIHSRRH